MSAISHPSESIWLPGSGELRFDELRTARAVQEYDPDLELGQDRESGQWAVFLRRGDGSPYPVLGLGMELPSPDRVKQLLYQGDVRRRGKEILDELDRYYEQEQKAIADRYDEAREAVAEAIASNMQDRGVHPFPTIYMGGRGKKNGKERIRSAD